MEDLIAALGVSLYGSNRFFSGCCPIHGGDNPGAINLYRQGETRPGYWKCNTRHCNAPSNEGGFGSTILGFVRGVLSAQKLGWGTEQTPDQQRKRPKYDWRKTVDWCCEFIGIKLTDIHVDHEELEKLQFAAGMGLLRKRPEQESKGITRATVQEFLEIPAMYFVEKGYCKETMICYDVGYYNIRSRELSSRAVVPVYDNDHKVAIGFSGRSVFDQCRLCKRWHDGACPSSEKDIKFASKWITTFPKENYLYNYWFAKQHIRDCRTMVLCEGPGDIWRLEESGIRIGLGMFGTSLSDAQQIIIEMSGVSNVIILTDNDDAGKEAKTQIANRLKNICRVHIPDFDAHDIGSMTIEQVKNQLLPAINVIISRGF